jgi:hypothetical protein
MMRKYSFACLAALLISLSADGQPAQTSTEGYELFSWKVKGHWYYSLLPGRNRQRTYEEITSPGVVRRDSAGLRSALQKLTRGQEVFWMSDAPDGASRSTTGQTLNAKHPSRQRIKSIKAICDELGIKLKLSP